MLTKLFNRRKIRTRAKIKKINRDGLVRLSVFRSNKHIYAQLIDDKQGVTVASASTKDKALNGKLKSTSNIEAAIEVGKLLAERAKSKDVTNVVFDKGGYSYHGKIKSLADAARENGLVF